MKYSKINRSEPRSPKSRIQKPEYGTLYVVSTPIGNLEDITLRALNILKYVDIMAAENVAHTKGLCKHYGIKTRLTSCNQHNEKVKVPGLIRRLNAGDNIAIVTDAGTPGISDPGRYLINTAANEGITVTPIPGPCAMVSALSVSGMPAEKFIFFGFLSNRPGKRKKELLRLTAEPRTMVFFETPHRIKAMLTDLKEILGNRNIVILREMTKIFEEVKRGSVTAILKYLTPDKVRGEFTLVVAGSDTEEVHTLSKKVTDRIKELVAEKKMSIKDIAGLLSSQEEPTYRQIYKECLIRKRELERIEADGIG